MGAEVVSNWRPKTTSDIEEERAIRDICYKSGDSNTIPTKSDNTRKEKESSERRVPIESTPRTDHRSFDNGGIQTLNPKVKPTYQQRHQSKNYETASSSPYGKETGRYTYLNSAEPRRSAYVVYRTVTQKPNFNGSTVLLVKHQQWHNNSQRFDITGISETWWDETCDWSALLDGSWLFRMDRQGRRGRGVALYGKEGLEYVALTVGNGTVESLWVQEWLINFNTFVSDMGSGIDYILSKFADDTKLCGAVNMLEESDAIQRDLDRLERWACENLMKLSKTKRKVLRMGRATPSRSTGWAEGGSTIPGEKHLRVLVDEEFNATWHCTLAKMPAASCAASKELWPAGQG
ncbi:hypothetical protein WISP_109209 [Willisornis vidua]|uniref:Rna-directed dna polymerase from mobile element jockey-like n=1 Tax=Willisornis vidua TaxID=1566151 RepID=A0ABQ9D1H8_9PASS|nr:hypothetical protein WISP_109209 [Willisornis vidua]